MQVVMFYLDKTLSKYGWMYILAALVLVCLDVIVMLSAQDMTCTGALGSGMSAVQMLKSVGDMAPPRVGLQQLY